MPRAVSELSWNEHELLPKVSNAHCKGSSFSRAKLSLLIVLATSAALLFLASEVWPSGRKGNQSLGHSLLDLEVVPLDQQSPNYEANPRSVSLGTCVGHLIDASTWASNLGLKVAAAIQQCDPNKFGKIKDIPDGNGFIVNDDPALLPAFCSRTIFTIVRDVDQVADFITGGAQTCKPRGDNQTACARSIEGAIFAGTNVGRFAGELRIDCDQAVINVSGFFACADRLEALAWNVDALASGISRSAQKCAPPSAVPANFGAGACTGEITAAAAYIASGSLYLTTAVDTNCKSLRPEQFARLQKSPEELQAFQARCARDSLAFVRMLGLAGTMAAEASGHCGNLNTDCGASIGYAATALSGAGQAAAEVARFCKPPTECCFVNRTTFKFECHCDEPAQLEKLRFLYSSQCARFTASMVKLLSVTAGMATQASAQCNGQKLATNTCGTMVSSAIAGFGFLAENIARTTVDCKKQDGEQFDFFGCGQRIGFIGDSIDTSSRTIGATVANCGFGNIKARADPIPLRRRFYVP